jgi:1-acyl-sn-glycerol-3-phosphate acyltransferase
LGGCVVGFRRFLNVYPALFRLIYRLPWLGLHVLFGTPVTLFFFLPGVRHLRVRGRPANETMMCWWARMVCRIFGVRREYRGCLPQGAALVAANHISWLDIQLLHSVAPLGFVAKAEIAEWPVVGWLASVGGTVFHRRGSHDSASGVGTRMAERLAEGGQVAIFPEGGIFPPVAPKHFHARMFGPAIETGSPVVPTMIRYSRNGEVLDDVTFLPGEHFVANFFRLLSQPTCRADVHLLDPVQPEGLQRKQLAARAELAVRTAYEMAVL